jgi:hypothetical protein
MLRPVSLAAAMLLASLAFSAAHAADNDPLSLPGIINGALDQQTPSKVFGKEIFSFEPTWIIRQLMDHGTTRAALSECNGQGLLTCEEAKVWLQSLDAQCNTVLLGIIDLGPYPGIDPKSVFSSDHPELMLFVTRADDTVPQYVNLFGRTEPNFFAAAMCPAESNAFGAAMRGLHMMNTIGHQPR